MDKGFTFKKARGRALGKFFKLLGIIVWGFERKLSKKKGLKYKDHFSSHMLPLNIMLLSDFSIKNLYFL